MSHTESSPLTDRQATVLQLVSLYHAFIGEPCPSTYVAKRLSLHHETVRQHFGVLYRKGWLVSESCPATPDRHRLNNISTYRLAYLTR